MQKINTADGLFVDGNQSTGVPGTILTAAWLNMVQAELISVLTAAGITVDGAKSDQLATAIQTLQRGKATVNVAGGVAVTLTAAQYGLPILILTGALTANINVIFPASSGAWIVRNQTTGAYTVTCKTAAGSGVVVSQGFNNALWGDGTNIYTEQSDWLSIALTGTPTAPTAAAGTNTTQLATMAAVQQAVNGKLTKSVAGGATVTLTTTEAGYAMLELTGALTANIAVVVPTASGQWIVKNSTTGAYTLTVKTAAGTGVVVKRGVPISLWCDGSNVLETADKGDSPCIQGAFKNLQASATGSNATVTVSADEIALENATNGYVIARNVALAINSAAVGANGLDTGTLAANTWYSVWVIWNGTTVAGVLSLSPTAPTMPAGYTHKARVGWIRTDGTANKYPLRFIQAGRRVRYTPAAGTNLPSPRIVISGAQGSTTTPTWVAADTTAFIPPTAIFATFAASANSISLAAAPNNGYAGYTSMTNTPPIAIYVNGGGGQEVTWAVESNNLYYAASGAAGVLYAVGWEDNI